MYLTVKEAKALENYLILLTFENGEKRQFDMKPYLEHGIFRELKDKQLFRSVKPCFDSVEWDNEADVDPKILYRDSINVD